MRARYTGTWLLLGATALLLGGCQRRVATPAAAPAPTPAPTAPTPAPVAAGAAEGLLSALEGTLGEIYTRLNKSVVNIRVVQSAKGDEDDAAPFEGFPFPFPGGKGPHGGQRPPRMGSGSGFVWDKQGHIVTNNHVVAGADKMKVTFQGGVTVAAKLVGTDPGSDLAVIKVDLPADRLFPVTMADSSQVKVGQLAIALGNPFGLEGSQTVGFISALGRLLPTGPEEGSKATFEIPDVLQTDAPINPGNSGGVLVDRRGQIIGVTSAIVSPAGANAGIGFAIPSAVVTKEVPSLIAKGRFDHPYLGIVGVTLTPELAQAMNLGADQQGALVRDIPPGGPADQAGVRGGYQTTVLDGEKVKVGGDVIVGINDRPVRSFDDVISELSRSGEVGKPMTLSVLRGKQKLTLKLTPTARPSDSSAAAKAKAPASGEAEPVRLGIAAHKLTPFLAKAMNLPEKTTGVLISSVERGAAADRAGLKGGYKPLAGAEDVSVGGDVIVAAAGQPVDDMPALAGALNGLKPGGSLALTVLRGGQKLDVKVTFTKDDVRAKGAETP